MRRFILLILTLALFVFVGAERIATSPTSSAAGQYVMRMPGVASDSTTGTSFDPGTTTNGIRYCRFLPGISQPAVLAPEPPPPAGPAYVPPPPASVSASITAQQLAILDALSNFIQSQYVDPAFNGHDWQAIRNKYAVIINQGVSPANFNGLMAAAIAELGDEHSYYQSAQEVIEENQRNQSTLGFVGTGLLLRSISVGGPATVIAVFPGGPAAQAGVLPHDLILDVNGLPPRSAAGANNMIGTAGSVAVLRIQRPGGGTFTKSVVRQQLSANVPVDSCLVAGTRIGYIMIPTLLDATIDDQVRAALQKFAAAGPLTGLIIDNREDGGGSGSIAQSVLGFFTSGTQGAEQTRTQSIPFVVTPENIGGSQTVPLVVLVGPGTVSFGEVTSGILQNSGRAKVIGTTTYGNVEVLTSIDFPDGSRAWIATRTFQPTGLPAGVWEDTGIVPDISVNSPWSQFTESNDPALARAIQQLSN